MSQPAGAATRQRATQPKASSTIGIARELIAVCIAILAVVAGVVAARGPAIEERSEYSWPPQTLPDQQAAVGWYAPILLLNRVPAVLEVDLPCGLSPPIRPGTKATVISTSRTPGAEHTLVINRVRGALTVGVGSQAVGRIDWPTGCPAAVHIENGVLHLGAKAVPLRTGALGDMPIVTGLFTGLDIRRGRPPHVAVTTRTYQTTQAVRGRLASLIALALAVCALVLVSSIGVVSTSRGRLRLLLRRVWTARRAEDLVVVGVLGVWWILGPVFSDDGWIWSQHAVFHDVRGVNFYFDAWGGQVPLGQWLQWPRNIVLGATPDLVLLRIPTLLVLIASWPVCRHCVRLSVTAQRPSIARWTLAATFLVGAVAWGMTLRLEPLMSLWALVVLGAMLSFHRQPRAAALAVAVPLAAMAPTVHPAGLLVSAPVLASLPDAIRWVGQAGTGRAALAIGAVVMSAAAIAIALFTLGADLSTRAAEAAVARSNEPFSRPFWGEYVRYLDFDRLGAATAVRHLSLGVLLLAILLWITQPPGSGRRISQLPGRALLIGLLLLALVPSKWPWHFGVLLGMGAVAFTVETVHLLHEDTAAGSLSRGRSTVLLSATALIVLWSWGATSNWSAFDLQKADWKTFFGFEGRLSQVAALLAACILALAVVRRKTISRLVVTPWPNLFPRVVVLAAFAAVGCTSLVLAIDAIESPWSPSRQNLQAITGGHSCGLADRIALRDSRLRALLDGSEPSLVEPALTMFFPCVSVPRIIHGELQVPRLVVLGIDPWLIHQEDAPFSALEDLYELVPVEHQLPSLRIFVVNDHVQGFVRIDPDRVS